MAKMISVATMKAQVCGMLGTSDLTEWETEFAESIEHRQVLTDKQTEVLERIWKKHFAG
jgi:hypothetical protein